MGGLLVRRYAQLYRSAVAGIVRADATSAKHLRAAVIAEAVRRVLTELRPHGSVK